MSIIPFVSLSVAAVFAALAWHRRGEFASKPYFHWFLYLHLSAVGLHQFEEYGWPGGFRDAFVSVFGIPQAPILVPSAQVLEFMNAFGLTLVFGLIGWLGTRVIWVGLGLLYANFSNGFFHLIHSVIHMTYLPGTVTGTLLYLPLGLSATRFAVVRGDIDAKWLMSAFALGIAASFLPFIHVWLLYWVG
jgi:hypothetical protein